MRTFFMNYRRRYNLDTVLKDYEKENGPLPEENQEEKMEQDDSNNDSNDVICLSPTPPVKKEFKNNKIVIAQGNSK